MGCSGSKGKGPVRGPREEFAEEQAAAKNVTAISTPPSASAQDVAPPKGPYGMTEVPSTERCTLPVLREWVAVFDVDGGNTLDADELTPMFGYMLQGRYTQSCGKITSLTRLLQGGHCE